MRVLLVSVVPVNKSVSSGNTLLNVMENFDDVELRSICVRAGEPDTRISKCFCITEKMLIKNLLGKGPAGQCFVPAEKESEPRKDKVENGILRFVHAHRWTLLLWAQAMVWHIGRWKNKELKTFVEEYDPDVVFTFLSATPFLNRMIMHVMKLAPRAKLVLFAWDNTYSYKQLMLSPLMWIQRFMDRFPMRKVAVRADKFYVICKEMKKEYEKSFDRECKILTKGADFTEEPKLKGAYNRPLQLVYTGNILLNRWKSLAKIAEALERINRDGVRAQLRIYTANALTKRMDQALNRGESSMVMGSVPSSQVAQIQKEADMLVHVESMDLKNRLWVRQSFSTKIVDYLAASRPILAYGPFDVASIAHLRDNDCAVTAKDPDELYEKLAALVDDDKALDNLAARAYACGRAHHQQSEIRDMLRRDFDELLGSR